MIRKLTPWKDLLRPFIPPVILTVKRRFHPSPRPPFEWTGDYGVWDHARAVCAGYDDDRIVERVRAALLQVKSGRAVSERDSVLLDYIPYRWPVIAALLNVACANQGRLGVMDFGGSLGSSFYHCRAFLAGLTELHWNVVEQPRFVEIGRRDFREDLGFFENPQECLEAVRVDVVLLSSVLQYLAEPHLTLRELLGLGVPHIVVDRTAFWSGEARDRLTIQRTDFGDIQTSYPAWFFHEPSLLAEFTRAQYRLVAEFEGFDRVNFPTSHYKGFFFTAAGSTRHHE